MSKRSMPVTYSFLDVMSRYMVARNFFEIHRQVILWILSGSVERSSAMYQAACISYLFTYTIA